MLLIIEILVYVGIAAMTVFYLRAMNKAQLTKIPDFIFSGLILALIIIQIFNPLLSQQILYSDPPMALICIGAILVLALIYLTTRIAISSTDTQKYARKATLSAIFIVFGVIFFFILIDLPETKMDLYRMPFALALCISMTYYPPALDRLKASRNSSEQRSEEHKDAVLDTTTEIGIAEYKETEDQRETTVDIVSETTIEQHRTTVINLATESWRFAKGFERGLTQLSPARAKRRTSQLQWFLKKTEESLEDVGLRIVNVEGYPYDPGMAATPLNIEDFDPDDPLVIDKMLEPIIMEGTLLAKTGTVTLRRMK